MTLVLGPSGGGKSTLLHILGGMDRPSAGNLIADGVDVSALSANPLAQWRRRTVGFVFQSFYLLPGLSVEDSVALPLLLDEQSRQIHRGCLRRSGGMALGSVRRRALASTGLFLVRPWLAGLGLLFGGGVAALAGATPANHAAKIRPVEALRGE